MEIKIRDKSVRCVEKARRPSQRREPGRSRMDPQLLCSLAVCQQRTPCVTVFPQRARMQILPWDGASCFIERNSTEVELATRTMR